MATKKEVFSEHKVAYYAGNKTDRGVILDHVCAVTRLTRKAAIRKFRTLQRRDTAAHQERRGRKTYYTPDATAALHDVWDAGDQVCGELLSPLIAEYVAILRRDRMWIHDETATEKLLHMSEMTVKRRIGNFRRIHRGRKGISSTKPSHLKHLVPIFVGPWKDKPPGYGQIDTVRHSNSATGDAVYTVNYTDAATMTVCLRAQWNKGQEATRQSLADLREQLPFPLLGAHPDSGSEFLNRFVIAWCETEHIELSLFETKPKERQYVRGRTEWTCGARHRRVCDLRLPRGGRGFERSLRGPCPIP